MAVEYCVVSIGTLSHNRLWDEPAAVRTGHATSVLVRDDGRTILVDPSLPGPILAARLHERTGKQLSDVTDVFCTTLRPVHRRGLEALEHANWWCSEKELETYRLHLSGLRETAERLSSEDVQSVETDLALLSRVKAAPEKFGPQVHLYPLTGPSPGSAGLLLTPQTSSVMIAGDAVVTAEHLRRGRVWAGCFDAEAAMDSLRDVLEIADLVIPGHDNVMVCPRQLI